MTGAGSGIGEAAATLAAKVGANVVVTDIRADAAARVAEAIALDGGRAVPIGADVSREGDVRATVDLAVGTYGRLDGALNNAAVVMRYVPVQELSREDWDRVHDVNLTGVFLCMKHEILAMGEGGGSIVNISSTAGLRGQLFTAEYTSAKHGVLGLTKTASIDVGPIGIRVNAICPGFTITPATNDIVEKPEFAPAAAKLLERSNHRRFGKPAEIAEAAVWLLSDRASMVTGATLSVDGGYTTH